MATKLVEYRRKRDFTRTPEPGPDSAAPRASTRHCFVVQKHDASHLHYDFRLEIDGVMKSWAVPKGPSLDPGVKRLAVEVEDHPIAYNQFEGTIPEGQYGGGTVMLWDRGEVVMAGDPGEGHRAGKLEFVLHGERLRGAFTLRRMHSDKASAKPRWLLVKRPDEHARLDSDVTAEETRSVTTGRAMTEIGAGAKKHAPPRLVKSPPKVAKATPRAQPRRTKAAPSKAADRPLIEQLEGLERDGGGELSFDDGVTLTVTHLDRVIFPAAGVTKGALMRYYARVAPVLLPLLADRPLAFKRYPRGVDGPSFYQQEPSNWPDGVRTAKVRLEDGTTRPRLVGGDLPTLLYTLQLGAISTHPWHARIGSLATPDSMVIDLDPEEGLSYDRVVEVAQVVRSVLGDEGFEGQAKTSGASGLHVIVPFERRVTWKTAAATAERVARAVAAAAPGLTTLVRSPAKRPPGTVYVDFLQNARGKTVASAWSVRATPGATVSVPLSWSEVKPGLDPRAFTLDAALARLEGR